MNDSTKPAASRKPRSPEVQARLKEFHSKIGQELVDNLNRNVMTQEAEDRAAEFRNPSIEELKAMTPDQRADYVAQLAVQNLREATTEK